MPNNTNEQAFEALIERALVRSKGRGGQSHLDADLSVCPIK